MTANEMVTVARLADHYEKRLPQEHDPLEVATHDFNKFKRDAPELWRFLRESDRSDRQIGDWLSAFFDRKARSGMTLKNFAADELDQIADLAARPARTARRKGLRRRHHASKKPERPTRILSPSEYPANITGSRGAYRPDVVFAAQHPLGLYHVEHHGAGHLQAYFTPKRKGSRPKTIGGASSMEGAMRRIQNHEDEMMEPDAPREMGQSGPVSIFALGRRTGGAKTPTQLDREIEQFLATYRPPR